MNELTFDVLRKATASAAAFRCRRRLQPGGGEGDKVFPPTFAGAVYAIEKRHVAGRAEPIPCVLLDSVQSQANRMELALQEAVDARARPATSSRRGSMAIQDYEDLCPGLNQRTLHRDLKDLLDKGLLKGEGATNHLQYKLAKNWRP